MGFAQIKGGGEKSLYTRAKPGWLISTIDLKRLVQSSKILK